MCFLFYSFQLIIGLFEKLSAKLSVETADHHPLMDLAIALTPHLDEKHMKKMFEIINKLLTVRTCDS